MCYFGVPCRAFRKSLLRKVVCRVFHVFHVLLRGTRVCAQAHAHIRAVLNGVELMEHTEHMEHRR